MRKQRFALFTHDAYGLGHIRRSVRILSAIAERRPQSALLLITGSPVTHLMRELPANADVVKIPTIVTSGVAGTLPPTLPIGVAEIASLRGEVTRGLLAAFDPDVFLVDNFPLGARLELLAALRERRGSRTRTVLGLRDVVDPPEKVKRDWGRDGLYEIIERYYDRVLVYGMREALDAVDAYGLSDAIASRLSYCGYVTDSRQERQGAEQVRRELGVSDGFFLATVGGGGDGRPLLETFLGAMERFPGRPALVVTGELMAAADRKAVRRAAAKRAGIEVRSHVEDLPSAMAAAGLVVAMGGYNTSAEILAVGARAVLAPRSWRAGEHGGKGKTGFDEEQLVRAEGLARLGAVGMVDPRHLSAETLAAAMQVALDRPPSDVRERLRLDGAARAAEHLIGLAEETAPGAIG